MDNTTGNSSFALEQDIKLLTESDSRFGWHVICLSMKQIKELISFFKVHVSKSNKGVSNLIDKIEFYDEEEGILTEKPSNLLKIKEQIGAD